MKIWALKQSRRYLPVAVVAVIVLAAIGIFAGVALPADPGSPLGGIVLPGTEKSQEIPSAQGAGVSPAAIPMKMAAILSPEDAVDSTGSSGAPESSSGSYSAPSDGLGTDNQVPPSSPVTPGTAPQVTPTPQVPAVVTMNIVLEADEPVKSVGTPVQLKATVTSSDPALVAGQEVRFEITSGPHSVTSTTLYTDSNGVAVFTYNGVSGGIDTIIAEIETDSDTEIYSNPVNVEWVGSAAVPEFPTPAVPVIAIISLFALIAIAGRRK